MVTNGRASLEIEEGILVGDWLVEPSLNQISSAGKCARLEPKAMQVLLCLAQQPGKVLSKEQLICSVWPDAFVTDQVLTHAIWQLRRALGGESGEPKFIQTIPRGGYRLVAPVRPAPPVPQPALAALAAAEPQAEGGSIKGENVAALAPLRRHPQAVALGLIAMLTVAAALLSYVRVSHRPAVVPLHRAMLLVLPFDNLSGDPEQEYLSDGMTEEMITQMGRLNPQRLGVISRASAMTYKGKRKRADEIGSELHVDYILEGSVRQDSRRLRITAQLIAVKDQTHLWAQEYDQDRADLLKLQADIAQAIAREISVSIPPGAHVRVPATTTSPEAYRLYLLGRFFLNKRDRSGLVAARAHFQQAIALDPRFAPAYSGLADCLALSSHTGYGLMSVEEGKRLARPVAIKALELDPNSADAHASLAFQLMNLDHDPAGSEREARRALELDPNHSFARHLLFGVLASRGLLKEALEENERALQADPLWPVLHSARSWVLQWMRRYDEAEKEVQAALQIDPNFVMAHNVRALLAERQGRLLQAIEDGEFSDREHYGAEKARRWAEESRAALGESGPKGYWKVQLDHLREYATDGVVVPPWYFARIYAYLGDRERAFEWLNKGGTGSTNLLYNSDWDPLRSDPGFQKLLQR